MATRTVTLQATIDENQQLVVHVPADLPVSRVDWVQESGKPVDTAKLTDREIARAKLKAAGVLVEIDVPADAKALSKEELERIGHLLSGDKPFEAYVDEEREERF